MADHLAVMMAGLLVLRLVVPWAAQLVGLTVVLMVVPLAGLMVVL